MPAMDGFNDFPIVWIGQFSAGLHDRPDFDAEQLSPKLRDEVEGLGHVPGIDDCKAAQEFLGLGERTVGYDLLTPIVAYRLGRPNRLQPRGEDKMTGCREFRV